MNDEIVVVAQIKQDIWKSPAVGLDHKDIWNYPGLQKLPHTLSLYSQEKRNMTNTTIPKPLPTFNRQNILTKKM